jgi:thiol-disulfide isomerase/thioredoxin
VALVATPGCIEVDQEIDRGPTQTHPKAGEDSPAPTLTFEPAPPNGFNQAIAWRTLEDGLEAAQTGERPMMLVVHASWCPRCKELKPSFDAPEIAALSEKFAMVNVDQDEVTAALSYGPDGTYIPRVLFFDPKTGQLDDAVLNAGREKFKYYYGPRDDLAATMRGALARYDRS